MKIIKNYVVGSFQGHAPIRTYASGTLVGRRYSGNSRDLAKTGLSGPSVLLVRATRRTVEHARSAVHAGIHHFCRGGKGCCTAHWTSADGESEGGPHQRHKKKRRSQGAKKFQISISYMSGLMIQ